jgi:hypothetical protein
MRSLPRRKARLSIDRASSAGPVELAEYCTLGLREAAILHARMPDARTEHSRIGIASFVIATLSGLLLVGLVSLGLILRYAKPPGDPVAHGFWLLALALLTALSALVALGLGTAGALQRRRKRLFAFLGIVCSTLVFAALITLNAQLP